MVRYLPARLVGPAPRPPVFGLVAVFDVLQVPKEGICRVAGLLEVAAVVVEELLGQLLDLGRRHKDGQGCGIGADLPSDAADKLPDFVDDAAGLCARRGIRTLR